jgi:4-amino-4-deoxychorismate lyase
MIACLVDGEVNELVSTGDRGLHYGDGLYETIAVLDGQPRFWQGHMDRLATGCERLGLPMVPQSVLLREVRTVSAGCNPCMVKIILTRGVTQIGYRPRTVAEPTRIVSAHQWPAESGQPVLTGVSARICRLRLGIQPELAGLNHLNRLEQIRARAEWNDDTVHEGILLDREDNVVSAIRSNIFLVFGERILTPRLDRCGIRGVMRAAVLAAFRERCEQRRVMLDMLPEADEIFLSNALHGIYPVTRIDHWEYDIGPVTREVQEWLAQT